MNFDNPSLDALRLGYLYVSESDACSTVAGLLVNK